MRMPPCPLGDPNCFICARERERRIADAKVQQKWFGPYRDAVPPVPQPPPAPVPQPPRDYIKQSKSWQEVIKGAGFTPGNLLGSGCYANTYELNEDPTKIVKVTGDKSDACAAELARRHQANGGCRNLVRVFRVWRMPEQRRYIIIAEKLKPIPVEVRGYLPHRAYVMNNRVMSSDLLQVAELGAVGDIRVDDCYRPRVSAWALAALNIKGICEDLRTIGVRRFTDFHLDNVMVRPGDRVVVSDFGCSDTPQPEIEVAA